MVLRTRGYRLTAVSKKKKSWKNRIVASGEMPANQFLAHNLNARRHPGKQRDALRGSLDELGYIAPVIVSKRSGKLLDGHARIEEALTKDEDALVPYIEVDITPRQEAIALAVFDKITDLAEYDKEALDLLLQEVSTGDEGLQAMLSELAEASGLYFGDDASSGGNDGNESSPKVTLSDRFIIPPFTVLDARQGYWQDRKRAWLALGIQSELGRGDNVLFEAEQVTTEGLNYDSNLAKGKSSSNGLLGESEQARSKYKNAAPGGSLRPAMSLNAEGKTERGDGKGKPMRKTNRLAPGGTGANSAYIGVRTPAVEARYANKGKGLARSNGQDLMRGENLTWVKGRKADDELDETSRKNLAAGRKSQAHTSATELLMEMAGGESASHQSGTSIFDPVLCELAYRWFSGDGAAILDPFAGGSVRGIVAAKLGRKYTGVDLRGEQIEANKKQAKEITPKNKPRWITGDSRFVKEIAKGEYDLLFTCPPYADLEVYSDDPQDISTLGYDDFIAAYNQIIANSLSMLKQDRFAVVVVGDVRDKKGIYRNFVSHTIDAFQAAGARLYNEAILVTSVGSLPIRVGRQFEAGRKLGKTHQNVLVFIKGDAKKATQACGKIDVYDPAEEFGEVLANAE